MPMVRLSPWQCSAPPSSRVKILKVLSLEPTSANCLRAISVESGKATTKENALNAKIYKKSLQNLKSLNVSGTKNVSANSVIPYVLLFFIKGLTVSL